MNSKTTLLFVLAMCLSFPAILGFMLVLSTPDKRPKRKRVAVKQTATKPTPKRDPALVALEQRKAQRLQKKAAAPSPLENETTVSDPTPPAAAVSAAASVAQVDQAAVREIQKLKREIQQQVSSLEKNRNNLVSQLARQLVDMPAANAATQIKTLDDEAATRVLAQISTTQRNPILQQLTPKRAKRLNRSLAAYAAN